MIQNQKFTIQKLPQEQSNKTYLFTQLNALYDTSYNICQAGIYYPYNHQSKDSGWGCAWRAIQALLSTKNIQISFEDLYFKFSQKQVLVSIIVKANKYNSDTIQLLNSKVWAPAQIDSHWAQPFTASIACLYYQIPHSLLLLNGPAQSYAPPIVFGPIINFKQFRQLAKNVIKNSSIMIDDGKYALSIIGIRQTQGQIDILFADPHIKSNKEHKQVGVYRKIFNLQGKSVKNYQTSIQESQSLFSVYQKLQFQTKPWMICFATA